MSRKFAEYNRFDLSEINKEMMKNWEEKDVFRKSTQLREGFPSFVFYEGPPSANGMPGIHHMIARSIKDIFCRYKTMKGFRVNRKAGWDTHGLPVELGVEKNLGITKEDIGKKISVEDYNAACRKEVMKYTREWEDLTRKMGYWVDMNDPYITYDNRYIETLWWLLKQLYDKGLLYKGYTIQPYSPAAGTGLSTHELNQPGCYRDVKDTTVTALFKMTDPRPEMTGWGTPCFVAWTTTPWTLPSNTALCVGPNIDYVAVRTFNPYTGEKITLVMAEGCVGGYFKPEGATADLDSWQQGDKILPYRVLPQRYKGSELLGMKYEQLMPWVKPLEKLDDNAPDYVRAAAESEKQVFEYDPYGNTTLYESYQNGILISKNIYAYKKVSKEGYVKFMTILQESYGSDGNGGLVGQYKVESETDSLGRNTMNASYGWNYETNTWQGEYKIESIYTGDKEEPSTMISYAWDPDSNNWYGSTKTIIEYDETGEATRSEQYYGQPVAGGTKWTGELLFYIVKDSLGNVTETVYMNGWDTENDTWSSGERSVFSYVGKDQILEYSSWSWSPEKKNWIGNNKMTYSYNDQLLPIQENVYMWDYENDLWTTLSKTDYSYTDNGILKEAIKWQHNYDEDKLVPIEKFIAAFQDGKIVSDTTYSWDEYEQVWIPLSRDEYIYDTKTDTICQNSYYMEDEEWILSNKVVSVVDANNNVTFEEKYSWDAYESIWIGERKNEASYDEKGRKTMEASYSWEHQWIGNEKREMAYDDYDNVVMNAIYYWNYASNQWQGRSKEETIYDKNGYITLSVSYSWDEEKNDWKGSYKYERGFDASGKEISSAEYSWDEDRYDWRGRNKWAQETDQKGHTTLEEYYNWDDYNWCWKGSYKSENLYDDKDRNIYSANYYGYEDSVWIGQYMNKCAYDVNDNMILSESYRWSSDRKDWRGEYKEEYQYDEDDNQIMRATYTWDEETWAWKGESKYEYDYSKEDSYMRAEYAWDDESQVWYGIEKVLAEYFTFEMGHRDLHTFWYWNKTISDWEYRSRETFDVGYNEDGTINYHLNMIESYDISSSSWVIKSILKSVYVYAKLSGIDQPVATASVIAAKGQIKVLSNNQQAIVRINNLSGAEIARAVGSAEFSVPAGIYMVTVDNETVKIVVR